MATSWPTDTYSAADIAVGDYAADQAVATSRVAALVTRDEIICRKPMHVYFTEQTRTNTAYGVMFSFGLYVPAWAVDNTNFLLYVEGKVDAGTGTWRIVDNATATASTEDTITGTSYANEGPVTLAIASAWIGTTRTIDIEGKATSTNTIYLRSLNLLCARFTD